MSKTSPTDFASREEAEAAMQKAQAFFMREADAKRQETLKRAEPVIRLAESPELAAVRTMVTDLYALSGDEESFPNLRNVLTCFDAGVNGIRALADQVRGSAFTAGLMNQGE